MNSNGGRGGARPHFAAPLIAPNQPVRQRQYINLQLKTAQILKNGTKFVFRRNLQKQAKV